MTNEQAAKTLTRMVGILYHEGYNSTEWAEAVTIAIGYLMREKSLAMTKLEEAVMWANASIARNE